MKHSMAYQGERESLGIEIGDLSMWSELQRTGRAIYTAGKESRGTDRSAKIHSNTLT